TEQTQLHGFEWRYLWKRSLGDFAFSFPSRSNHVWKLTFSPDGKTLAALEDGARLRLLDLATRAETVSLTNVFGVAGFTPDSQELILIQREGKEGHLLRYKPNGGRFTVLSSGANRFGWLPDLLADGRTAVLPELGTELSLVDIRNGDVTAHLTLPGNG